MSHVLSRPRKRQHCSLLSADSRNPFTFFRAGDECDFLSMFFSGDRVGNFAFERFCRYATLVACMVYPTALYLIGLRRKNMPIEVVNV